MTLGSRMSPPQLEKQHRDRCLCSPVPQALTPAMYLMSPVSNPSLPKHAEQRRNPLVACLADADFSALELKTLGPSSSRQLAEQRRARCHSSHLSQALIPALSLMTLSSNMSTPAAR